MPFSPAMAKYMTPDTFTDSGAFVTRQTFAPYTEGPLSGLTFAVKDNIDLKGLTCSYGSPAWGAAHPPASHHALCVEQLLSAGATCLGSTVSDEFTYSLQGENPFFGTPLNPKAPGHIPGGSSSGSASAVACGLVDFALGTDCAGSVRVPASFCGVWGMRPTAQRISAAGVLPSVPSVSTVGVLANSLDSLSRVMPVLLSSPDAQPQAIGTLYVLEDAMTLADPAIQALLREQLQALQHRLPINIQPLTFAQLVKGDWDLKACNEQALRLLQSAETGNAIGHWLNVFQPQCSPGFQAAFANVQQLDRSRINLALQHCEQLFAAVRAFTGPGDLFCFPTVPLLPPGKGQLQDPQAIMDFYDRCMAVSCFAGVARLPEISIPLGQVEGLPVGLSLVAGHYQDLFLLAAARALFAAA
ncbi:amidase family protein [Pseudomonas sp. Fl4BN1]|uniref:amidase family protein n=1 Tax=Pseudomonas sp. Fl4BN1 TaxID=2697651 RepID=UPI001C49AF40